MNILSVIGHYFFWHYSIALFRFTLIYRDILFFIKDYFSLSILLKSFFEPWRRMGEAYPEDKFKLKEVLAVFVVNSLMRLVGMIMRSIIIIIGVVSLILIVFLYPILILLWLGLPLIILLLLGFGFKLLFF
ncbi:MAG: hypothetical protein WCX70_00605 [Candidatus Paceibacterota bacterium]|jgi:hypothetical protein